MSKLEAGWATMPREGKMLQGVVPSFRGLARIVGAGEVSEEKF
jgi:hypothetical protein